MLNPSFTRFDWNPASLDRPSFHYRPRGDRVIDPIISIITPAYNCGEIFLNTALSVLRQSYQHWEWVIVDDGSDDGSSAQILDDFARAESRVQLYRSDSRKGPSETRNTAIEFARGSLIYTLDADDLIEPSALEKYLWVLYSFPEVGFVSSFQVGFGAIEYLFSYGFQNQERFLTENGTDAMALIRKTVFEATGGYDRSIVGGLEDWDFWMNSAERGFWGYTIPEYLEWYRRKSGAKVWPNWDGNERQERFHQQLKARYPNVFSGKFPPINLDLAFGRSFIRGSTGLENPLEKISPRVLVISDSISDLDRRTVEFVGGIESSGLEVTFVALNSDSEVLEARVLSWTPDVFVLDRFLPSSRYMQFFQYLSESRAYDVGLLSSAKLGYASQLLTRECGIPFIIPDERDSGESLCRRVLEEVRG